MACSQGFLLLDFKIAHSETLARFRPSIASAETRPQRRSRDQPAEEW